MKKRSLLLPGLLLWLFLGMMASCRKDQAELPAGADMQSADAAIQWFEKLRELTKVCPGFSPPVASRAFAYSGIALYESVVAGMPGYQSLEGSLTVLRNVPKPETGKLYYWPASANAALSYMAQHLYANMPAEQLDSVKALEQRLTQSFLADADGEIIDRSVEFGRRVAEIIFDWSAGDGGHEGYKKNFPAGYVAATGPGTWKPTAPNFQNALQPYWGFNREIIPGSINFSQPVPPKPYSTDPNSPFYIQALEVYATVNNLTAEEKTIARYWSDDPGIPGTPPGHSISIATQVLEKEKASLALAAETYCKTGMAISEAFVSCWRCKYHFNLLRPITYIRENIDDTWNTLLATPPFPEYTSGHSVQSGAAAQVLSDLFGYNYAFTDRTHEYRTDIDGSPRSYGSFFDMADEAAVSRLYGGIHYRDAIEVGLEQGRKIGQAVRDIPAFKQ